MTQTDRSPGARLLARLLRQRAELGISELTFETLDRAALRSVVRHVRSPGPAFHRPSSSGSVAAARVGEPAGPAAPPKPSPAPSRAPSVAAGSPVSSGDSASASSAPDVPSELPSNHDDLRTLCLDCTRCGLSEGRTQVVFHDGNPDARLMVIGEGPGANEDRTGVPFVGRAGQYLDLLLASVGLSRDASVYISNVVKCRPPGNRNPRPEEIEACAPYLRRQIELVRPEAILAVGTFSAQLLTGSSIPLGRLRGEIHAWQGTPLVVTYHPAALLRNSGWVRPTWDDLQLLRQVLDGPVTHGD